MKKILTLLLSCVLIFSSMSVPVAFAATEDCTVDGITTTSGTDVNQYMMNGGLKTTDNLLYQAFPKKVFTKNSSYSSDKQHIKYGTNTGSNGQNAYTFSGSNTILNFNASFIELTNGEIDLITDNDLRLDEDVWNRSKTNSYMVIEYDLGSNVELDKFYVCWTNPTTSDKSRICGGYQLYSSTTISDLYSEANMIYSVEDNKEGINVISFPANTVGRYFAIKITKCDDGTPASYIYPRCKEIALSGERLSENYATWSGIPTNIVEDESTAPYWMNGLPATDPTNIINGITPITKTYTDANGSKPVTNGSINRFTNGIFDDSYTHTEGDLKHFTAATYMNDNTYMDIVWDLGETKSFWEAWLAYRIEPNNNPFYMVKYSLYAGNDKSTLFSNQPIITVDGNIHNVNKISFNKQSARYFAIRVIVPNSSTKHGEQNIRVSIMELSLVGIAKRSLDVMAVDTENKELEIAIEGADTKDFEGNSVELKAPATADLGKISYAFDKFTVDGKEIESVLENGYYKTSVEIQVGRKVLAIYKRTYKITTNALVVKGGTSETIENLVSPTYKKHGETYNIVSEVTKTINGVAYKLSSWNINGEVIAATENGNYSIVINDDTLIEAIYTLGGGGEYLAIFTDNGNNQLGIYSIPLDTPVSEIVTEDILKQLNSGKLFGYNFTGSWSNDLDIAHNTTVHFKPIYKQDSKTYEVKVGYEINYAKFDEKINLMSQEDNFSSWSHGDSVISTKKEISIYTPGNITLKEKTYGEGKEVTDYVTVVTSNAWDFTTDSYSSAVTANINGISEENFIECGMVFTSFADIALAGVNWDESFVLGGNNVISKELTNYPKNGCYMINLQNINLNKTRYARAYVKHIVNEQTVVTYSKSIIKITAEGENMPEQKKTDIINEYKNHPLLPLYGDNAIPFYNETYAQKIVNGSKSGNGSQIDNNPTIAPYLVECAKKCVIIFPGGGYFQRSDGGEGIHIAQEYNKNGYSAFVVRYRVGDNYSPANGYNLDAILSDGQRAVQFVRYNAKEFGINPNKIAVCGFSAGGHLSMMVSQNEHESNVVGDRIGEISNIPNAVILSYAVTTMDTGTFSTMPSILSGGDPQAKKEIVAKYSGEKNVTPKTPATFIWYGEADDAVSPTYNSVAYYNALQSAGINSEIYSYAGVKHGVGLNAGSGETAWHYRSVNFLNKVFG